MLNLSLFAGAALYLLLQQPSTTAPAKQAPAGLDSDRITRAENLLERGDFKEAEPLLKQLAAAQPADARLLFDLGFTQEHNDENEAAVQSYQASIAADGNLAEPLVALGLLEARTGRAEAAHHHLQQATTLTSASPAVKARALRALCRLDQTVNPEAARGELSEAIQLTGEQPGDAQLTAALSAEAGNTADAEAVYRSALAKDPQDLDAALGLSSLLLHAGKLPEADALLTPLLAAHTNDPRIVAQTATLYAEEGKTADALSLVEQLRTRYPEAAADPTLTRLYAHLLLVSGNAAEAEPLYRTLVETSPRDPSLLDDLGSSLVREQKFDQAEAVLAKAVARRDDFHDDQAWAESAGHLAFAASRNHQPQVALQALHARATVLPNSAATLFLEATSHDALHENRDAIRGYRAFLAMANGKLPNEEFEARHRLIALEHEH
ncbi:MAG: tetratricopeptide repeat protein [Terriglobus roseus]|nr:tetratricopeptide repeat protein [Terriglobus roseus]